MANLTKARAKPRKIPKQDRSREMVATILEATARVLVKEGYARATTNRVAAAAGISVGSLYHYFPGKDALVVALMHRHRAQMLATVGAHLSGLTAGPLETTVPALIRAVLDAHGINPKLHRVLLERVLNSDARAEVSGFEPRLEKMVHDALASHKDSLRVKSVEMASFILVQLIVSVARTAVVDRPRILKDGAADPRLVDELSDVVLRYLLGT